MSRRNDNVITVENLGFVDKYYVMDPATEDILFDGTGLVDGMVVLIERTESREDIKAQMTAGQIDNARWNNRWCKISRIEIRGENISFFATYDDHTVKKRVHNVNFPWLVKLDSLPNPNQEQKDNIFRLVYQGLQYEDSLANGGPVTNSRVERASTISDKIIELAGL